MKIAFIVNQFPTVSETFIISQMVGLIENGHDLDIYAGKPQSLSIIHPEIEEYQLLSKTQYWSEFSDNYLLRFSKSLPLINKILWRNPRVLFDALNYKKYNKYALSLRSVYAGSALINQRKNYDVIHCHFGLNGLLGVFLREAGIIGGKIVTTFHGYDASAYIQKFGKNIYKHLFEQGDLFLVVSDFLKNKLIESDCPAEKILVHRVGIDLEKFTTTKANRTVNIPIKIISVGRLIEKKGIGYGIESIAKIAQNYPVEYTIVGTGELMPTLQNLIKKNNLGNVVKMVGSQPHEEIVKLLGESDLLLAPSVTAKNGDQEGIPVVIMEAMAMGLPVISTEHTGIPELVKNNVSGFIVPERDVDAIVEKIAYLIHHPNSIYEMGKEGRIFVEKNHNNKLLTKELIKIYQNLL
jgi:colanic acid/amylovoran biosynthesis glycosyltransferase